MNILKTAALSLVIGIMGMAAPSDANALCGQYLKIYRTFADARAVNNYSYYYAQERTTDVSPTTWYFRITEGDDAAISAADNAYGENFAVYVVGSSATCPTTGTFRFMGDIQYIYTYSRL